MTQKLHNNTYFADWIEGKISDTELKTLVSDETYHSFLKLKKSFDVLAALEAPMDETLAKIKAKNSFKSKKQNVIPLYIKRAVAVAASLLVLFGVFTYFNPENNTVQYASNFGEQKTITLLDGSEVILNAKSSLSYNKKSWKNKRELTLDGEAYFKVTKGSTFTVNTNNGSVTVLGTQFNVASQKDFFNVKCFEGRVQVTAKNYIDILTPGKGVQIVNDKATKIDTTAKNPAWIAGMISFDKAPLAVVLTKMEKQFGITFNDKKLDETLRFTGSIDTKNLNIALAAVFKPLNIAYRKEGKKIFIRKK